MRRFPILFILLLFCATTIAHPWKPKYYVIVDTDCGYDDLRALSLMLASPDIRILAITTSNGVLDAVTGYHKVKSLMNDLHHEGLLVGASSDTIVKAVNCSPANELKWGSEVFSETKIPTAVEIVDFVINNISEPVTFVNLGSLNTVACCMESCSLFKERFNRIIWSTESELSAENFNYSLDTTAFNQLQQSHLDFQLICGDIENVRYSNEMAEHIQRANTILASKLSSSIKNSNAPYSKVIFDEVIPLYMHFPEMFQQEDDLSTLKRFKVLSSVSEDQIVDRYLRILQGETVKQNQVFKVFPLDTVSYFEDVQKNMIAAIDKFGIEEWMAQTITAELHGHLGVYAVIGVKMGMRVKDYFGAGTDELIVLSYAGNTTPYSCLNDGIQVSTGATLGHGLIRVDTSELRLPSAEYTYMNRKVLVKLKDEYRLEIQQEIKEYNRIYGLSSDIYWELVRNAAIRCWMNWDRNEIFDIQSVY